MTSLDLIKRHLKALRLSYTLETIEDSIAESNQNSDSYEIFLEKILKNELAAREQKRIATSLHRASFPVTSSFDDIQIEKMQSLSKKELNQLKELGWVNRGFNLIFLGPPGAGKTMISTAIGVEAIQNGYKVFFTTMNNLIRLLKTQDMVRTSTQKINYILKSDLLIIDDLMFMALEKKKQTFSFS